jgi:hypothetical protein
MYCATSEIIIFYLELYIRKPITANIVGNNKKYNCHAFDYTHPIGTFTRLVLYVAENAPDVTK